MTRTPSVWESGQMTLDHAKALTLDSVSAYGPRSHHWDLAVSGGMRADGKQEGGDALEL